MEPEAPAMTVNEKTCYLCAKPIQKEELDEEHVFPESLFNRGDRGDLIKLAAHRSCNRSYSADDEYFRLCMTAAAFNEPNARRLWDGPVLRGVRRTQAAGFRAMVLDSVKEIELHTEAGDSMGRAPVMYQDAGRIRRVANRMGRGLFTHLTGEVLPADWTISSDLIKSEARADPGWSRFYSNVRSIGNGTVRFSPTLLKEDLREGFYWIVLYGSIDFWVFTGTKIPEALRRGGAEV